MPSDFDVVIIGGGGAGLAAGIMARAAGASVMVIEADTKLGGATAWSGGVMFASGTSVQRSRGLEDTPDAMYRYVMTLAGWQADPRIMRVMSDRSGEALEWLISLGAVFPPDYLVKGGVEEIPRAHPSTGVAEPLINGAGAAGVETGLGIRVEGLLVENGRVTGVRADGTELRAGAVIVATGGFGNNPDLIRRLYPTAAQHGDWVYAVHKDVPFIQGDGIRLGEEAGARIVGHDTGLLLPSNGLGRFVEAFIPPWVMMVNEEGRRFMNEAMPYAVSGYVMNDQPNAHAYAIFDEPTLVTASQDLSYADPYHSGQAMPTWAFNMLRKAIADGKIFRADTLEDLAQMISVPFDTFSATVETYNSECGEGTDRQFFKEMPDRFPIHQGPFYAREMRASVIGQTGAGLNISPDAEVLDVHGRIIPGLYAAGEVLGCAVGKRYSGGGMGICNAMVFGRIAGDKAAAFAKDMI